VETQLRLNGAREWQIEKCAQALALSLQEVEPPLAPQEAPENSENMANGGENPV
jgi:hypothetical protein